MYISEVEMNTNCMILSVGAGSLLSYSASPGKKRMRKGYSQD